MRISIVLLGGSQTELSVHSWNSVRDVKAKYELQAEIQGKHSLQPDFQRMFYQGRQLEDPWLLSECNIQHVSTLHVCPELHRELHFKVELYVIRYRQLLRHNSCQN